MRNLYTIIYLLLIGMAACTSTTQEEPKPALFTSLTATQTGIDFINQLTYDRDFNIYTYRNFYNGGGVALGDVNQDSLLDIYFTSNMGENKLYLNKGNFKFEDITKKAGVAGIRAWSTGVSMADVNGDGLLDIYVCNSGDVEGDNKQNELFINNGDLTFTEKAEEYGLADRGYSTHAAFFDYDRDGDLDCYLLNNSYQAIGSFNLRKNERPVRDPVGGDKLYRNDGERFTDVSEEAGIYGSIIGFGLGVTVGDVNKDGWQDIFVSNDFFERDYLYLNQQAGPDGKVTFKECLEEQIRSISGASMGADMADINNDTYAEIFVTEMLPEDNGRLKTKTTFENWNRYQYNLKNGYYHQFTRNMLHLNNGNNTFSEIGRLSGVHATDWSWGALITDLDNDGHKDIYVANGIYKDLTDQDYIQFISNEQTVKSIVQNDRVDFQQLIDSIPSERIPNYMYVNQGEYGFTNKAKEWGLAEPSHSNGAAYGDLDNDGDLDLVVNNVNMPAFVYRNEADKLLSDHHYLRFILHGEGKNTFAIGTQLTLWHEGQSFYQEQMPMRGFQSTVDPRPNFGLGDIAKVDSVIVNWPDGKITKLKDVASNQTLTLYQKEGQATDKEEMLNQQTKVLFEDVTATLGIDFTHQENDFVDFDRDRLLFHMLSREGPALATADVNGDGLEDIYIGGAKGQSGALYLQSSGGSFTQSVQKVFSEDSVSEDVAAVFFDADGDHDLDLYVGSGGSEFSSSSAALLDRLYLNNGKGEYTKSSQYLPTYRSEITGAVDAGDYDGDGDQDLFVGIRMQPFSYGLPTRGYILENDGSGNFTDATEKVAPSLLQTGMITDGKWVDINGDKVLDLIIVGEWMPIKVLYNEQGQLLDRTAEAGLDKSHGWWNKIEAADMDGDGDIDFVVGNHGLNSRFKTSAQKPLRMWVSDFDRNGAAEQIISQYNGEHAYPLVLRHDLLLQMPGLKKKYLKYEQYKNQQTEDIFVEEQLSTAVKHEVYTLESSILINGGAKFKMKALPTEAQFSPVYGILIKDFDKDGQQDIVLGGNFYAAKPEVGRYDASYGLFLKRNGKNNFKAVKAEQSGLNLQGEIREIQIINVAGKPYMLVAGNNQPLKVLSVQDRFPVLSDQ